MPKSGKSSASSGTRKKHAKRAAAKGQDDDEPLDQLPPEPKGKKGKKADKKAPRPKVYIPPVKPAAPRRDPLDTHGLASQLPADLVVVLRLLGKKDAVTKGKALDELQAGWIERAKQETTVEEETTQSLLAALEGMLPVWLRPSIRFYLHETAGAVELEQILGAWCMSTFDVDRMVSLRSKSSWDDFIASQSTPSDNTSRAPSTFVIPLVASFVQLAIMAPNTIHQSLNPPAPEAPIAPSRGLKSGKSTPRPLTKPASNSTTGPDPDEEHEADRNARYRVGALGALTWLLDFVQPVPPPSADDTETDPHPLSSVVDNIFDMLNDPLFWSSLYASTRPPWVEAEGDAARQTVFGTAQPEVRKSAWALIPILVRKWRAKLESSLPVMSVAALRSAWVETDHGVRISMFEPLLIFLKAYPSSWVLADPAYSSRSQVKDRQTDAAESSGDESEADDSHQAPPSTNSNMAYTEFLDFLKLGCGGSPVQGYPVVLVALSTIPEEVLPLTKDALTNFFTSLWAAVDGRALSTLDKSMSSIAFASAAFECTVYLAGRIQRSQQPSDASESGVVDLARDLARQQAAETWDALEGGRLVMREEDAGSRLAQFLVRLGKVHVDLAKAAAEPMCSATLSHISGDGDQTHALARKDVDVLAALAAALPSDELVTKSVVKETVAAAIKWCSDQLKTHDSGPEKAFADVIELLSQIVREFGPVLKQDVSENPDLEATIFSSIGHVTRTLSPGTSIEFLLSSLSLWSDSERRERLWSQVLSVIESPECSKQQSVAVLSALLKETEKGGLPSCSGNSDLGGFVQSLLQSALSQGDTESSTLLGKTLVAFEHFIPLSVAQECVERAVSTVVEAVPPLLHQHVTTPASLRGALQILSPLFTAKSPLIKGLATLAELMVNILVLAYILCLVEDGDDLLDEGIATAKLVSKAWVQLSCPERLKVRESFFNVAHSMMQDVQSRLEVTTIVDALSASDLLEMLQVVAFDAEVVLPPISVFEQLHSNAALCYIDTPLALFDPSTKQALRQVAYDRRGLSNYGRVLVALLEMFKWDRQVLSRHSEMIVYLLLFECAAEDFALDFEETNPIFGSSAEKALVASLQEDISMAITYAFSSAVTTISDDWHQRICSSLKINAPAPDDGILSQVISGTFRAATSTESKDIRDLRIFRKVLAQVCKTGDITAADADQWILLSDNIRKQASQTSLSITLIIAQAGVECTRLDRLRNELASTLSGIPPQRASTDGLRLLRHLVASAPLPDSEGVYLPPQRAVFLLQALQKWVASDEELNEEIDSLLVELCSGLAPILFTVPGSHWDFMFDLMESNLEASSVNDSATYVCLMRTLGLISMVDDIASNNKAFRTTWLERRKGVLDAFAERLLEKHEKAYISGLQQKLLLQLLVVARRLRTTIDENRGFVTLLPLLRNSSPEIQLEAFQLLVPLVANRNERVVVEAAVESDQSTSPELPSELLKVLKEVTPAEDDDDLADRGLALLLPWLLALDFFEDISIKVKNSYLDHLGASGLVETRLIPIIVSSLDLKPPNKSFPIEMWAVDEFYLDLLDDSLPSRFQVLAAHLLYRSLTVISSATRSWYQDLKERRLADSISQYISRWFTPMITEQELSRLKEPSAAEELSDENFSVKVHASAREVSAIYTVDDQQMNIRVAFPADYPLRSINVEGGQQLGISSNKWKAWLLNVQMVANQTGSLVDALALWKKNISLHFEGQVECAICYS
ncbi:listerin E3 ubiquitin protein ligase 1 [Tulasnella sp. 424]|nr:listerin E3 ubiquitin protein ligase 1 [Tulasnella sp. 424]KAG8964070.1 listerin E3 ubiquitin protein ligase 1 [Tulasnella sp. 425]